MDHGPSNRRAFRRIAGTASRVRAVCIWHRALGHGPARQLLRAWQDFRALSRASAARREGADVRIPLLFTLAGLAASALAIERFPGMAEAIAASGSLWLVSH